MKKTIALLTLILVLLAFAGCQIADKDTSTTTPDVPPTTQPADITIELPLTKQTAVTFALNHAGAENMDVKHLHVRRDTHTEVDHYDVDFHYGDYCYEYELNEQTGEILKFEKDHIKQDIPEKELTAEEAKAIALEHAGLTEDTVTRLTVEFDREDNYYEVDFIKDGYEYNYEVCAQFGKILDADKEWDD